jgi:hypothetical protein
VPMFTWGLVRSNFCFDISGSPLFLRVRYSPMTRATISLPICVGTSL